jgi:hypothetical protein
VRLFYFITPVIQQSILAVIHHQIPLPKPHEFALNEAAEQSKYLMSEAEETLAAELTLSGGNAFGKLQGTLPRK